MRMRRTFEYKFLLNEQEIRRICDILDQQMKKKNITCKQYFTVKFKNGGEEEIGSLDKVLDLENDGDWVIRELSINNRSDDRLSSVSLDFEAGTNIGSTSITFSIEDKDRDWVYVVSSLLEERINKIKRFSPKIGFLPLDLPLDLLGASMIVSGFIPPVKTVGLVVGFSGVVMVLSGLILANFYIVPSRVFYWGDMIGRFNKAQSIRNFILIGVIVTLILGIIGSVIASYVFEWLTFKQ